MKYLYSFLLFTYYYSYFNVYFLLYNNIQYDIIMCYFLYFLSLKNFFVYYYYFSVSFLSGCRIELKIQFYVFFGLVCMIIFSKSTFFVFPILLFYFPIYFLDHLFYTFLDYILVLRYRKRFS